MRSAHCLGLQHTVTVSQYSDVTLSQNSDVLHLDGFTTQISERRAGVREWCQWEYTYIYIHIYTFQDFDVTVPSNSDVEYLDGVCEL